MHLLFRFILFWNVLLHVFLNDTLFSQKRVAKPKQKADSEEEPHVYCFRKRKETNYMKLEVPNDDEFVCRWIVRALWMRMILTSKACLC